MQAIAEVDQQIDDYYDQLQRRLQQQREELKKELHEVSTQKTKALSLQLEQVKHTQAHLETAKELHYAKFCWTSAARLKYFHKPSHLLHVEQKISNWYTGNYKDI